MGIATRDAYRYLAYTYEAEDYGAATFAGLGELRTSLLFEQSKSQYPPGYEAHSIEENPQFR